VRVPLGEPLVIARRAGTVGIAGNIQLHRSARLIGFGRLLDVLPCGVMASLSRPKKTTNAFGAAGDEAGTALKT
jgi:hypothetical protein